MPPRRSRAPPSAADRWPIGPAQASRRLPRGTPFRGPPQQPARRPAVDQSPVEIGRPRSAQVRSACAGPGPRRCRGRHQFAADRRLAPPPGAAQSAALVEGLEGRMEARGAARTPPAERLHGRPPPGSSAGDRRRRGQTSRPSVHAAGRGRHPLLVEALETIATPVRSSKRRWASSEALSGTASRRSVSLGPAAISVSARLGRRWVNGGPLGGSAGAPSDRGSPGSRGERLLVVKRHRPPGRPLRAAVPAHLGAPASLAPGRSSGRWGAGPRARGAPGPLKRRSRIHGEQPATTCASSSGHSARRVAAPLIDDDVVALRRGHHPVLFVRCSKPIELGP